MVWFLWKKTWNMGGWGMKNLLYTNLFDISNFFCLDCVWESFQRAGFQEDVHRPDEEQFLHQPFGHRRVTVQEISCHSFGIYYFFCRLQDIQGLGTCFIWVADFFLGGVKRRRPCENPMRQNSFCFVVLKGMVINLPALEGSDLSGQEGSCWHGLRHFLRLGCGTFSNSEAQPDVFFFFPPPLCRECRVEGARQWSSAWYIFTNMYTLLSLCHISLKKVCKCV